MMASGAGKDDDKSSCSKCREYVEQVDEIAQSVDGLENRLNELKTYFATHEWVLIENAEGIRKLRNPAADVDMESLQSSYAQSVRFKRLVDSATRSLERLRKMCDDFGGLDENL